MNKASDSSVIIDIRTVQKDYSSQIKILKQQYKQLQRTLAPIDVKPMLATSVRDAFNDVDWLFEIKWDGYRALTYHTEGKQRSAPEITYPSPKNIFHL